MGELEKEKIIAGISSVLEEYCAWFSSIMRKSFYPEESSDLVLDSPDAFITWLDEVTEIGVHETLIETCRRLSEEFFEAAEKLVKAGSSGEQKPGLELLDEFINLYEAFIFSIHRLEKDSLLAGSGLDTVTGLRDQEAMMRDLSQEMERKARRGKSFGVVFARIDGYKELEDKENDEFIEGVLKKVAEIVRKCVRTYDDAYFVGGGEFVMLLKHTDITGAMAAVDRLRRMLREDHGHHSLSYVSAEPEEGDDVENLVNYLREDINRYISEKDVSLQYYEVSPLKRYMQSVDGKE